MLRECGNHDVMMCMALGHAKNVDAHGAEIPPTVDSRRDAAFYWSMIRKRQNALSRQVARLRRRILFAIDRDDGYVDFGGEA